MKTIAVFGGTGGLGLKLVPLLRKKYNVISLGSNDVDVRHFDEVQNFFKINDIDIVLNMAGKYYDVYFSNITEKEHDLIIDMVDVNVMGGVNVLGACLPKMISKRWGRVITISSVLAEMNVPAAALYSASKAFLDQLMSSANKENVAFGVTCNSIQLGYWDGGMCERLDPEVKQYIKESTGLTRWGSIEELYDTINYIVETEYLSGINLKIAGGL